MVKFRVSKYSILILHVGQHIKLPNMINWQLISLQREISDVVDTKVVKVCSTAVLHFKEISYLMVLLSNVYLP